MEGKWKKYLKGIDYEVLNQGNTSKFNEIFYDSRKIKRRRYLCSFKGATVDGHNYIEKAISLGAKLVIVSENVEVIDSSVTYVKLKIRDKTLGFIASNFYGYPQRFKNNRSNRN